MKMFFRNLVALSNLFDLDDINHQRTCICVRSTYVHAVFRTHVRARAKSSFSDSWMAPKCCGTVTSTSSNLPNRNCDETVSKERCCGITLHGYLLGTYTHSSTEDDSFFNLWILFKPGDNVDLSCCFFALIIPYLSHITTRAVVVVHLAHVVRVTLPGRRPFELSLRCTLTE